MLYNRVDANGAFMNNFKVIVTALANRNSGAECDPSQIPDSILAANVYNTKTFAARFNCSYPTGLVGRYVFITNSAGTALNFREVEVFASNKCSAARTATNAAAVPGTSCAAGAAWGAVCVHTCLPGFEAVSGSSSSTCNGETWNDPPLVCAPPCPLLPAPDHAAGCRQTMYREDFTNPASVTEAWVSLMESFPSLGKFIFAANGGLQISAQLGCAVGVAAITTSIHVREWRQGFTVQTRLSTPDRAGLVWRAADVNNFCA